MLQDKPLDELYEYRDKISEVIEFARLYKGKVNLGDKLFSLEELRQEERNIKVEIASRISSGKLRLLSKSKRE